MCFSPLHSQPLCLFLTLSLSLSLSLTLISNFIDDLICPARYFRLVWFVVVVVFFLYKNTRECVRVCASVSDPAACDDNI